MDRETLQGRQQGKSGTRGNLIDELVCSPNSSCLYHLFYKSQPLSKTFLEIYRKKQLEMAGEIETFGPETGQQFPLFKKLLRGMIDTQKVVRIYCIQVDKLERCVYA